MQGIPERIYLSFVVSSMNMESCTFVVRSFAMPFLFERNIENHIRLGLWKIESQEQSLFRQIRLSSEEHLALEQLKCFDKQNQRLAYRKVLIHLLGQNDFIIRYDEYRKPHLIGFDGHISVSHSGDMAAAMLNYKGPAGIDVERISPRISSISKRFLSIQEQEECGKDPENLRLTLYWSAKEALFKMDGKRILSFSNDIYIKPFNVQSPGIIFGQIKHGASPGTYALAWETFGDYVLVYTL